MPRFSSLPRRRTAVLLVVLGVALGAVFDAPRILEGPIRRRLVRAAAARGLTLHVGRVAPAFPLRLVLRDVVLEARGARAAAGLLTLRLRPALSRSRALRGFSFDRAALDLPGGVEVDLLGGDWKVERTGAGELKLKEADGEARLAVEREGDAVALRFFRVDASRLARVRWRGEEAGRAGVVSGALALRRARAAEWSFDLLLESKGARVASLDPDASPRFGAPLDLSLAASGLLQAGARRAVLDCLRLETQGATLEAEGEAVAGEEDLWAKGAVRLRRVEIGELLAMSGVPLGEEGEDLGSVGLEASGSGRLKDPSSIRVEQDLSFTPPPRTPAELLALRGPFTKWLEGPQGRHPADLRPENPDFIPLDEVPPLFLRTLLISEDAGFWGHPGIDLQEIPVAFATNWNRGERARGASTITQQLAKNLFLTGRKSYARKLHELALTLLLESTLGKRRILEIYLNVVEWGPGTYGLRPAARKIFGKEPSELTPREGAFLVALIPSPIRYRTSIEQGLETPRFARLVNALLAKLRSVDAITEEDYLAAREEPLVFGGWQEEAEEAADEPAGPAPGEAGAETPAHPAVPAAPPAPEPAVTPAPAPIGAPE